MLVKKLKKKLAIVSWHRQMLITHGYSGSLRPGSRDHHHMSPEAHIPHHYQWILLGRVHTDNRVVWEYTPLRGNKAQQRTLYTMAALLQKFWCGYKNYCQPWNKTAKKQTKIIQILPLWLFGVVKNHHVGLSTQTTLGVSSLVRVFSRCKNQCVSFMLPSHTENIHTFYPKWGSSYWPIQQFLPVVVGLVVVVADLNRPLRDFTPPNSSSPSEMQVRCNW